MRCLRGVDTDAAGEAGLRLPRLRLRLPQALPRPSRRTLRPNIAAQHGSVSTCGMDIRVGFCSHESYPWVNIFTLLGLSHHDLIKIREVM